MIQERFWLGKRVLITGHTGFKGSWLTFWLLRLGAEIWGFSLDQNGDENLFSKLFANKLTDHKYRQQFHHHTGDIRNPEEVNNFVKSSQPDIIFHLAAQSLVRVGYKSPLLTWNTNLLGSLNLLESLKSLDKICAVVMVTTDKVYINKETSYAYVENDPLGGYDPYSASKASAELAIDSWRRSYCGLLPGQKNNLFVASVRSGNVIGGGDWAQDRIIPDAVRALIAKTPIQMRNPKSVRPWQHVLEPLSGYIMLAERLYIKEVGLCEAFNFGPNNQSNQTVENLIREVLIHWSGEFTYIEDTKHLHEAHLLALNNDKAYKSLTWSPRWDFHKTVQYTVEWYKAFEFGKDPWEITNQDLNTFISDA